MPYFLSQSCLVRNASYIAFEKDASYSNIEQVSEVNWKRSQGAKANRKAKGGANYHKQQYDSVPDQIVTLVHGNHLEPCYKKFFLIFSQEKEEF